MPHSILNTVPPPQVAWYGLHMSVRIRLRHIPGPPLAFLSGNLYLVRSGPGLEALELANTLRQAGEVRAAYPDWWQERALR